MPPRHSAVRLCGATAGGFVRLPKDAAWLRRCLRYGGTLCPECAKRVNAKTLELQGEAS